jgi:hypothetical protein
VRNQQTGLRIAMHWLDHLSKRWQKLSQVAIINLPLLKTLPA